MIANCDQVDVIERLQIVDDHIIANARTKSTKCNDEPLCTTQYLPHVFGVVNEERRRQYDVPCCIFLYEMIAYFLCGRAYRSSGMHIQSTQSSNRQVRMWAPTM